jgi:DNA-binding beta-propeller fold protein YncE
VLFVTNVLNGTIAGNGEVVNQGTVLRIVLETLGKAKPEVESMNVIGSGFAERTDPAALVIGPTGVGLDDEGRLYVADSLNNRIAVIPNAMFRQSSAGTGTTVSQGGTLNDPLGLAIGGKDLIATVDGNDGFLVITRPNGTQIFTKLLDSSGTPPGAGALFGLVFAHERLYFVDDATNTLNVLR